MKSLMSAFKFKYLFLSSFAWGWFEIVALPHPMLIFFLVGGMITDFMVGLVRSWKEGKASTPEGFQKTLIKLTVYTAAALGMFILANLLSFLYNKSGVDYTILVDGSIAFMTFIELFSIFKNLYAIDPNSLFSRKFAGPVLNFLMGRIGKNPINDIKIEENAKPD